MIYTICFFVKSLKMVVILLFFKYLNGGVCEGEFVLFEVAPLLEAGNNFFLFHENRMGRQGRACANQLSFKRTKNLFRD